MFLFLITLKNVFKENQETNVRLNAPRTDCKKNNQGVHVSLCCLCVGII